MFNADVVISGGGLVGTLLALLLGKENWRVAIVDPQPVLPHHDGRVLAINHKSLDILKRVGVHVQGEPILNVHAFEENSPWSLNFSHDILGSAHLGQMICYEELREALMTERDSMPHVQCIAGTVQEINEQDQHTQLTLSNGSTWQTPLWVGAEGKNSPSRVKHIGIKVSTWDYGQHAIVFHIEHDAEHQGRAYEVFRRDGPLAILPMQGGKQSCVVWNTATPQNLMNKTDAELADALTSIFSFYGKCQVVSPKWTYPLTHLAVSQYVQPRFALVGDAAHVLHPLAGQGVNLGWRDADALAQILLKARLCGLDWGSLSVLKPFEKQQKSDHRRLRGVVNGLHHVFSLPYGTMVRGMGMGVVNAITPLKRLIVRHAMG